MFSRLAQGPGNGSRSHVMSHTWLDRAPFLLPWRTALLLCSTLQTGPFPAFRSWDLCLAVLPKRARSQKAAVRTAISFSPLAADCEVVDSAPNRCPRCSTTAQLTSSWAALDPPQPASSASLYSSATPRKASPLKAQENDWPTEDTSTPEVCYFPILRCGVGDCFLAQIAAPPPKLSETCTPLKTCWRKCPAFACLSRPGVAFVAASCGDMFEKVKATGRTVRCTSAGHIAETYDVAETRLQGVLSFWPRSGVGQEASF